MLEKFSFIETCLYWGDGFTATELGKMFKITRQTAQGVIDAYRKQHPDAVVYDSSRKRQVAGPAFKPRYIRSSPTAFLDHLRGQTMTAYYRDSDDSSDLPFYDADHLYRPNLPREPVRTVLAALHQQQAITMYYYSKKSARVRDFSPNRLVFANNRYHIRGWCHLEHDHLDFVLSRIIEAEPSTTEWVSSRDDQDWNSTETLYFKPNPKLSIVARTALLHDFPLDDQGHHHIRCNKALAYYVNRELTAIDSQYGMARWVGV